MSKWILGSLIALTLVGCSGGRGGEERMKKMVEWKVDDVLDEVDATVEQRLAINASRDALLAEVKPLSIQAQGTRKDLVTEWKAQSVDRVRVHQVIDTQAASFTAFVHKVADAAIAAHDTLAPKQRDALTQRLEKR